MFVLKTGEHYDTIVTNVISGRDQGIHQVDLAATNLDNDGHLHGSPPGKFNYHDYINNLAYLEEPETLQRHLRCYDNDLCTNDHMNDNYMEEMIKFRNQYPQNLITGHLNINRFRNKFFEIHDMLPQNLLDLLFISEIKLDSSFPNAQFRVLGFKHYRADRNNHGGGIAAYIRNDLPYRRRSDIDSMVVSPIEAIAFEVLIRQEIWFYFCLYNPHYKHKQACCNTIDALVDACRASRPPNIFLIGDFNIDLLCDK